MVALYYTLTTLFLIVCIFLILLVLIQKGRGGGLSGGSNYPLIPPKRTSDWPP